MLGKPGSRKTTALRDIARCLSLPPEQGGLGLAVLIVDTSNEIAGETRLLLLVVVMACGVWQCVGLHVLDSRPVSGQPHLVRTMADVNCLLLSELLVHTTHSCCLPATPGDADEPHPCIGYARCLAVSNRQTCWCRRSRTITQLLLSWTRLAPSRWVHGHVAGCGID